LDRHRQPSMALRPAPGRYKYARFPPAPAPLGDTAYSYNILPGGEITPSTKHPLRLGDKLRSVVDKDKRLLLEMHNQIQLAIAVAILEGDRHRDKVLPVA